MIKLKLALAATTAAAAALVAGLPVALAQDAMPGVTIAEQMSGSYFVTWVEADVRSQPDGGSKRLVTLPFGSRVMVTGRVAGLDWMRVELADGVVGYMWAPVLAPMVVQLGEPQGFTVFPPLTEPGAEIRDDDAASARPVGTLGATPITFADSVGPDDTGDFYRFDLVDEWNEVTITLDGLASDADLALTDEAGLQVGSATASGTDPETLSALVGAGSYILNVYMYGEATPYNLALSAVAAAAPPEDIAGNDATSAFAVEEPVTAEPQDLQEWVGGEDVADYWSVTLTERADLITELVGLTSDADLSIEDDFGSVLASSTQGGAADERAVVTVEPGTYLIVVRPFAGYTEYTLRLSTAEAGTTPVTSGPLPEAETDFGALSERQTLDESVGGEEDPEDVFSFSLTQSSLFVLTLQPGTADVDVELLRAVTGAFVTSSVRSGTEPDGIASLLEPGDYLIRVYPVDVGTDYQLTVSAEAQ